MLDEKTANGADTFWIVYMIPQFAAAALAGFTSWMHGNFLDRYAGPRKEGDDGVEKAKE